MNKLYTKALCSAASVCTDFFQALTKSCDYCSPRATTINIGIMKGRSGNVIGMLEYCHVDVCSEQEVRGKEISARFLTSKKQIQILGRQG